MRIVGAPDYYDGTAYCRTGDVASLLVYRRSDVLVSERRMRSALRLPRAAFRGGVIGADGAIPRGRLARTLGVGHTLRWDAFRMRIDVCRAVFCGTVHAGLAITTSTGRSSCAGNGRVIHCWTRDAYEEALAEHGLMTEDDRHLGWFTSIDRIGEIRRLGIAAATYDPTDGSAPDGWRADAATLGRMRFDRILPADAALERLASWLGVGETRIGAREADMDPSMSGIASGGRWT